MDYLAQHLDKFIAIFLLLLMSISIRLLLQILGQRWITTIAHTATLVLLPLLTYVITNVISGNIALSLGMVGALSIVRFRNPVRSPLELSVYFGAITMGIAASVSLVWLFFIGVSVVLAVVALLSINYLSVTLFQKPFFTASFSEGNLLSTLDFISSEDIIWLDQSDLLNVKSLHEEKENIHYTLTSRNFGELQNILSNFKDDDRIQGYQLNR